MGWFWQNTAASSQPTTSSAPSPTPEHHASPPQQPPTPAQSREDAADVELVNFLRMIQADSNKSQAPKPTPTTPSPTTKPTTTLPLNPNRPSPASAAINESVLPTDMSCKDAFDYAWHCNSPGSQFTSVYRYGAVRSCSELWDDFWFCMRVKSFSDEMRAEAIKAHFRVREHEKYYAPGKLSSEDVWESREQKVAPGTAFKATFDDPRNDDAEWRLQEIERRRRIRDQTFGKD